MKIFIDQMQRKVELKTFPPKKIISLVPSITELLAYLGLENELIGITKFCVHPENIFKSKEKIGGTKNLNIQKIKQLQPDLIIGNKEENVKSQIEELEKYFPVWMSDVNTYEDALQMIENVGQLTERVEISKQLVTNIQEAFQQLENNQHPLKNKNVIYLIWYQPIMAVGKNTFIDNMLSKVQLNNAIQRDRYIELSLEELKSISENIDYILLSSEPYPFKEKHKAELEQYVSDKTKIVFVDGEVFSWYGVRMKYLPEYLMNFKV